MKIMSVLAVSAAMFFSSVWAAEQPKSKKETASAKAPTDPVAQPPAAAGVDTKTFIIGAEDVLFIKVWNEGQLTASYNVRPDGKISMPLIGEIQAANLTP